AGRWDVLLTLVLPLAYMLALYLPGEGNGRYHVLALPLLCVAAGAAVAWARERPRLLLGAAVLAVLALVPVRSAAWLVVLAALIPTVTVAARAARSAPRAALIATAAVIVAVPASLLVFHALSA